MLPKLASHILHQTSRAAATAQNYTFRNVLGFQSPSASSGGLGNWSAAGSSSWGSYGAGPGGAKYSSGSRFYSGYQNAGRAVTQANSSAAQDSLRSQTDDEEELRAFRPTSVTTQTRTRPRSNSLSLSGTGRAKRADSFGVLKTVQLHQARATHALARVLSTSITHERATELDEISSRPVQVRRNSISATSASEITDSPQVFTKSLPADTLSTDPAAPQSAVPLDSGLMEGDGEEGDWDTYNKFQAARLSGDPKAVLEEVKVFREQHPNPTVKEYNMALSALLHVREVGKPIDGILDVYNEMLLRQVVPNKRTYSLMIWGLSERDYEVHQALGNMNANLLPQWRMPKSTKFERYHMEKLKREDNFSAALSMFEALRVLLSPSSPLSINVYNNLLRSCAIAGNVDAAIRIFAHLEASGAQADSTTYQQLLSTYVTVGDIKGAEEVFNEFRAAFADGRISSVPKASEDEFKPISAEDAKHENFARRQQSAMWVKMIEAYFRVKEPIKALDVLSQMLESPAGMGFGPADVPLPCPNAYAAVVRGFADNGDVKSALLWFNRMRDHDMEPGHPLDAMAVAPKPTFDIWVSMIEALANRNMVAELNAVYHDFVEWRTSLNEGVWGRLRVMVGFVNASYLRENALSEEEVTNAINFLKKDVLAYGPADIGTTFYASRHMIYVLFKALFDHGRLSEGLTILQNFIDDEYSNVISKHAVEGSDEELLTGKNALYDLTDCWRLVQSVATVLIDNQTKLTLPQACVITDLCIRLNSSPSAGLAALSLQAYYDALDAAGSPAALSLSPEEWNVIATSACKIALRNVIKDQRDGGFSVESDIPESSTFVFRGLPRLLEDVKSAGIEYMSLSRQTRRKFSDLLAKDLGMQGLEEVVSSIDPAWTTIMQSRRHASSETYGDPAPVDNVVEPRASQKQLVNMQISRHVDEHFPSSPTVTPLIAYKRYEQGAVAQKYPTPETISRLIAALGRMGDLEKVYRLYNDAQLVLASLEIDKHWQSNGWFTIESAMIVALTHCGHVDKAHVHRQRIVDQGGRPSHDAYGALIQHVSETTDDSANALALWNEALSLGVLPNIFMYNTMISKLSKARKADMALDLFQQMRANNVKPSPVTYGAVIAACCRVGDAPSAELLFDEMVMQQNYRPRVPPYNTMIQFYIHTIRNRDRALHYYNAMLAAGVHPTSHTYKLLLDCYGTIEPIDVGAMEAVFDEVVHNPAVRVQGVHWAALINAYGCVVKDLDRAMEVFNSIAEHPTTKVSGIALPDAITYESLINVLVSLRRTDLIPEVLGRLNASGIHMTAYIANLMIKGFSDAGQIERSREIFESLADPPVGVAAPNNHAPHDVFKQPVPANDPVYREPSTWEAMIRAELGNRNKDKALALLQRLQTRQFPQAVYQRISGIMLDEDVAPWSSRSSDQSSQPISPASS